MIDFAGEWLSSLFGIDARRAIKRAHATRWNTEPWVQGAMSAAAPGDADARKLLLEPVGERVWFAGEALHETQWGTVNGAWELGERVAENGAARGRRGARRVQSAQPRQAHHTHESPAAQAAAARLGAVMAVLPLALIAWSSGKDSAWALHEARREGRYDIVGALTTVNETFGRVAMHGVREELLEAQVDAAGLAPVIVRIPYPCSNEIYEREMAAAMGEAKARGITHVIFGDLFLEDIRAYREAKLNDIGMTAGISFMAAADRPAGA